MLEEVSIFIISCRKFSKIYESKLLCLLIFKEESSRFVYDGSLYLHQKNRLPCFKKYNNLHFFILYFYIL